MKNWLFSLTLLILLAAPVAAQDADPTIASPVVSPRLVKKVERIENRVENRLQNLEQRRELFRERLAQIRDEKKQQILEHISRQLTLINDRATKAMLNVLERLQALLEKIKTRAPETDTTAAQAKIDEAVGAVEVQAAKEYIIEFTDESGLRLGASAAKQQLRADLKTAREKVRLAREAVVKVLQSAKEL